MKIKKFVAGIAAAAMLALSMGAFVGCGGQSDEDIIREDLTQVLDSIKGQDAAYMGEFAEALGQVDLEQYGIDGLELVSKYLSGFDYSIDSITVNGDTAEAVITLTCKSFADYELAIEEETYNAISTVNLASLTDNDINMLVGQIMMDALDDVESKPIAPITIDFTKSGSTWEASSDLTATFTNAVFGN